MAVIPTADARGRAANRLYSAAMAAKRLSFWLLLGLLACTGSPEAAAPMGREAFDTSGIALGNFGQDAATQRRVLHMSLGESAARLGALRYNATSSFVFSRGGEDVEQRDTAMAIIDSKGNYQVRLQTPRSQIEVYLVDDATYIRQDRGQLRKKSRREVDAEQWLHLAASGLPETLLIFHPRLQFSEPQTTRYAGREALHFRMSLSDVGAQPGPTTKTALPPPRLPVAPPSKWRELARPLSLSGEMWLDRRTGVVLGAKVAGRVEIADRDVRPTQLEVAFESALRDLGTATVGKVPPHVPEFRREVPVRDFLSFFRDHLPPPAEP